MKCKYCRKYFREWQCTCKICKNCLPRKLSTIRYAPLTLTHVHAAFDFVCLYVVFYATSKDPLTPCPLQLPYYTIKSYFCGVMVLCQEELAQAAYSLQQGSGILADEVRACVCACIRMYSRTSLFRTPWGPSCPFYRKVSLIQRCIQHYT